MILLLIVFFLTIFITLAVLNNLQDNDVDYRGLFLAVLVCCSLWTLFLYLLLTFKS